MHWGLSWTRRPPARTYARPCITPAARSIPWMARASFRRTLIAFGSQGTRCGSISRLSGRRAAGRRTGDLEECRRALAAIGTGCCRRIARRGGPSVLATSCISSSSRPTARARAISNSATGTSARSTPTSAPVPRPAHPSSDRPNSSHPRRCASLPPGDNAGSPDASRTARNPPRPQRRRRRLSADHHPSSCSRASSIPKWWPTSWTTVRRTCSTTSRSVRQMAQMAWR
jgi:hypothetical protein